MAKARIRIDGFLPANKTSDQIANLVRNRIATGELKDGDGLGPEAALIESFGVSRHAIRDALRILQAEGLVSVRRGASGGVWVNAPSISNVVRQAALLLQANGTSIRDLFEARLLIEAPSARTLALKHNHVALAERLHRYLKENPVQSTNQREAAELHAGFHMLLVTLTGNKALALVAETFAELSHFEPVQIALELPRRRLRDEDVSGVEAHNQVAQLILVGQGDQAEAHWRAHILEIAERRKTVLTKSISRSRVAGDATRRQGTEEDTAPS